MVYAWIPGGMATEDKSGRERNIVTSGSAARVFVEYVEKIFSSLFQMHFELKRLICSGLETKQALIAG